MEKLLFDQLILHIESNNTSSPYQSGFRRFHSTATALTKIFDDIQLAVEGDGFSVAVLLDFSKAFDSMSYDRLLNINSVYPALPVDVSAAFCMDDLRE
jgi:hypothetical protein